MKFREQFDKYACPGDSIAVKVCGFTVRATIERDDDMGPPWKEHDGHGPVTEWTRRAKRPGEVILSEDGESRRYYDWQEAVKTANRDGWDAPPYGEGTAGQRAVRAVTADIEYLRGWCRDEWQWVSLVLSVSRGGVMLDEYAATLGGIDGSGDADHLNDMANEMLPEAIEAGEKARRAAIAALTA